MKYLEKEFSSELKEKIKTIEAELSDLIEKLSNEYKLAFAQKGLDFEIALDRTGNDSFIPGYSSSITKGILGEDEHLELYRILIWECHRYFFGMPISKNIPGSKIVGNLMDESIEDLKLELNKYLLEQLGAAVD